MWYLIGLLAIQLVAIFAVCRKESDKSCRISCCSRGLYHSKG